MKNNSSFTRRDFLVKSGISLAGITIPGTGFGMSETFLGSSSDHQPANVQQLKKGQVFNESVAFSDLLTGRETRRLTCFRPINAQPTYHINTCFSADSRYIVLTTVLDDGSSALLRAEVATGDITVMATLTKESGEIFTEELSMIQPSNLVACNTGKSLRIYNLITLEEKILIKDMPGSYHPVGSIDGTKLFFPLHSQPNTNVIKTIPVTHVQLDIKTGEMQELFKEEIAGSHHVIPCPGDPDLLLIDRDFPRIMVNSNLVSDSSKSRGWILNIKTKELTEIRPNDKNRFQIHCNWSYKGDYVYYHGTSKEHRIPSPDGQYIGVADRKGKIIWEGHFPTFCYGHTGSHTRSNTIITDGLLTKNLMTAIHFEDLNSQNIPRIEILAQHDSFWMWNQNTHPHPHMSPDGKWLSYNRGIAGTMTGLKVKNDLSIIKDIYGDQVGHEPLRTDVYVVKL
jgi:hypothetical protein